MPIYEYVCKKCNKQLEIIQKITAKPLTTCPDCKGQLKKILSNTTFILKGTGWYATDYASNKGNTPKASPPEKKKDSSAASTETTTKIKEPAVTGR
ncbi:MAG: FmdB family transcriptional regulator [Nitrospira bacterium HGW-Nitrospira-1]|nr:MAG: FmdB family transcriptional regulator [Nitrospira bacterium HGW-Nitrospira-1]